MNRWLSEDHLTQPSQTATIQMSVITLIMHPGDKNGRLSVSRKSS